MTARDRPPPRKRNAGRAPGGFADSAKQANAKHISHRRRGQRPPRNYDALAQLEALFGPPVRPIKRGLK
jgi:hypothetical protein